MGGGESSLALPKEARAAAAKEKLLISGPHGDLGFPLLICLLSGQNEGTARI